MEKITYRLTAKSSLIVSPRASLAFYRGLGEFSLNDIKGETKYLNMEKLKVIYPFYQYGEYTSYIPCGAAYYLPGSSIKGAICTNKLENRKLLVDDIRIQNDNIVLRNLFKMQYLEGGLEACYKEFFDNVGVEMVKAESELEGNMYLNHVKDAEEIFKEANKNTQKKMKNMIDYLKMLQNRDFKDMLKEKLRDVINKLSLLLDETEHDDIVLFGGFKGLLHSLEVRKPIEDIKSGIYIDSETMLPHGLVKLEIVK